MTFRNKGEIQRDSASPRNEPERAAKILQNGRKTTTTTTGEINEVNRMRLPSICTFGRQFIVNSKILLEPRLRRGHAVVIINFKPTKLNTFVRMIARLINRLHSNNRPFSCNNVNIIIVARKSGKKNSSLRL